MSPPHAIDFYWCPPWGLYVPVTSPLSPFLIICLPRLLSALSGLMALRLF